MSADESRVRQRTYAGQVSRAELDNLGDLDIHPAADLFPLIYGADFTELVEDIREVGLREPVVYTSGGQLLDGRNRIRACRQLGIEPATRVEPSEPWAYSVSTNLRRRHLTDAQRTMIAARMSERLRGGSQKINLNLSSGSSAPPTVDEIAELWNVGTSSIHRAKSILRNGTPDLQRAVDEGHVKVATAERVARVWDTDRQDDFARQVAAGVDPRSIAPPDTEASRRAERDVPTVAKESESKRITTRHKNANRYVRIDVVWRAVSYQDALLEALTTAVEGLDPSITDVEAGQLLDDLSRSGGAYRRLRQILTQRKEGTAP